MTAPIRFVDVHRHFSGGGAGPVRALDGVSFEIADGELFTFLGPSGSGKTTCLRLIGGFEQPTQGEIELFGRSARGVPPYERDVNTVFQDYALFPHLDVLENVAYGLTVRGVPKAERRRRALEALALVHLPGVEGRRITALSGGQRQRVALARALVNRPRALLLDEPLGALDLKLRHAMQVELKALQKSVGITFVLVTHDQEEALSLSDRVAVMNHGRIEQLGSPREVYERPRTRFVASFVGQSNFLEGAQAAALTGGPGLYLLRPERIRCDPPEPRLLGTVREATYLGAGTRYTVEVELAGAPASLQVMEPGGGRPRVVGEPLGLGFAVEDLHPLEA